MKVSRWVIVFIFVAGIAFVLVTHARGNDSALDGYRLIVEDGVQYYRPMMSLDEYVRQEIGIFNPWRSDLREISFPVIPLKDVNLDTPGWSLWKSNDLYQVFLSTMTVGTNPTMFYVVDTKREVAIEVLGYGVEIGEAGEIFVSNWEYALLELSPEGHGKMLLPEGSAVGNMSLNNSTRQLAFEAGVTAEAVVVPGVAVLNLEDNSWELIAHRRSMDSKSYPIYVLWWADDNTIIINEFDYRHGYFLRKLDLQGNRTEYVSFDDHSLPRWGRCWFSPDKSMIMRFSWETEELFCFDLTSGTLQRYGDVVFARWTPSGELMSTSADGAESTICRLK